jgi:hypothetical protein
MNIKNFTPGITIFAILCLAASCNNRGNAQENFLETYSGSFQSASILTDTNNDGVPANSGEFEGTSTFGPVTIQSLNEFTQGNSPLGDCPEGQIEFTLVRGNFVKRFADTGDLLLGTWNEGISCFDPNTNTSETTQVGIFSGGTGEFTAASGPIEINFTSTFLATNGQQGYSFGGSDGTGTGVIE